MGTSLNQEKKRRVEIQGDGTDRKEFQFRASPKIGTRGVDNYVQLDCCYTLLRRYSSRRNCHWKGETV